MDLEDECSTFLLIGANYLPNIPGSQHSESESSNLGAPKVIQNIIGKRVEMRGGCADTLLVLLCLISNEFMSIWLAPRCSDTLQNLLITDPKVKFFCSQLANYWLQREFCSSKLANYWLHSALLLFKTFYLLTPKVQFCSSNFLLPNPKSAVLFSKTALHCSQGAVPHLNSR